jgi:DNA-binding NtrC family response regulator
MVRKQRPTSAVPDTAPAADGHEQRAGALRALLVAGPNGGARHLLTDGVVHIGRDPSAAIVVNDPRVSRLHVALHVAAGVMVSDLGSVNGTFVGEERLAHGEARPLAEGQPFFIGDSSLTIRRAMLRPSPLQRLAGFDEARRLTSDVGRQADGPAVFLVLRLTLPHPMPRLPLETILGDVVQSPGSWMLWLPAGQLLLGVGIPSEGHALESERAVVDQMAGWGLDISVESTLIAADQIEGAEEVSELFARGRALSLSRGPVVIRDPAMAELRRTVEQVAPAPVNVLILGETGVGKDVVASMVHELSPRATKRLVAINCANLPEPLLESELFGHERGAFTGASVAKPGLIEAADGGTVFLDEIGDLPLSLQAKLLRVIESREITRVGGLQARSVDVRFVAATNRDLAQDAATGRFRQDLFYRINSITLKVPPLRERPSEIEPLAALFLERACQRFGIPSRRFSAAALTALTRHPWPGNVRELRNVVERVALLAQSATIEPDDLDMPSARSAALAMERDGGAASAKNESVSSDDAERERIVSALQSCSGNQTWAADLLGISRRTLVRRIAELQIPRPRRRPSE